MQITNYKVLRNQYGINHGCEKLDRVLLANMIKEALALALKNGFDLFSVNKIPGSGNSMYKAWKWEITDFQGMVRHLTKG